MGYGFLLLVRFAVTLVRLFAYARCLGLSRLIASRKAQAGEACRRGASYRPPIEPRRRGSSPAPRRGPPLLGPCGEARRVPVRYAQMADRRRAGNPDQKIFSRNRRRAGVKIIPPKSRLCVTLRHTAPSSREFFLTNIRFRFTITIKLEIIPAAARAQRSAAPFNSSF